MTIDPYARIYRAHVRGWLVALALACFHLSGLAANSGNIGRANITGNGNSVSVTQATVNSGGSTIPVSPSIGGWTQAGNYGVPPTASGTTMNRTINGETVISGVRYPFQAGYGTPWKDLAQGALTATATLGCSLAGGGLLTAACAVTVPLALPYVYDWIKKAGGRINPDTGQLERMPSGPAACYTAPCFEYSYGASGGWSRDPMAGASGSPTWPASWTACGIRSQLSNGTASVWYTTSGMTTCGTGSYWASLQYRSVAPMSPTWLPSSMDDIAPYMQGVTPDGRVVGDILGPGQGSIPDSVPTVTGPSTVTGPVETTTNADGSKTSKQTTYNFSTAGNTITNTTNNTVTNNYNSSNQLTSTTTTSTAPSSSSTNTGVAPTTPDQQTDCDKYPNSLGCSSLDVPAGTIPRSTQTITFSEESSFGGGSCPADRFMTSTTMHQSVKVVDWTNFCSNALPVRALVLLLATFAAFLIVMPGKEVRT